MTSVKLISFKFANRLSKIATEPLHYYIFAGRRSNTTVAFSYSEMSLINVVKSSKVLTTMQLSSARSVTTAAYKIQDIPSPRKLPIVGTMLSLMAAGSVPKLHKYADSRHKQLGPIFQDKIGPVSAIFVSCPDAIRTVFSQEGKYPVHVLPEPWIVYNKTHKNSRGLFFMDGDEWLKYRRIMNKLLLKGSTVWLENACEHVANELVKEWESVAENNKIFPNLENKLYRWSIDVLISILVGSNKFYNCKYKHNKNLDYLAETNQKVFENTSKLSLIPSELAAKFNIPQWKKFSNSVTNSLNCARSLVINLLHEELDNDGLLVQMLNENLNEDEIVRLVSDLLLAAGDTTAYSMEWMLYCLAKHKNIQDRVRDSNDTAKNTLLRNIIKESLRLYPVAPFLTRILPHSVELLGYTIPSNTLIILSIYTSGRDKRFFDRPEEFIPDRWTRTEDNNITQMQYCTLPFAMGARSCIGRKIAEVQMKITLSTLLQNFTVDLKNKNDVEFLLKMVGVPSEPIQLCIKKITSM